MEKEDLSFKDYPAERLLIDSIRSRLTPEENKVRDGIMQEIIVNGGSCSLSRLQVEGIHDSSRYVHKLLEKKVIVIDEASQEATFSYPVSALPTPHRVTLEEGNSFFAMCAIDAMGAAFTFKQDTRIVSQCAACGQKVFMEIKGGKIVRLEPETLHVLHADLSNSENWASGC